MQDIGIKIAIFLAVAIAAVTSIPLLSQEGATSHQASATAGLQAEGAADASASSTTRPAGADASASASGKATYTATAGGYGDQAASHAWEMSTIAGELDGKLDSKNAKVGDRVVLKTIDKVQTSDGTIIPKGSRLIGHVTQAQTYSTEHGAALLAVAFDQVQMKNGQSKPMYMLIRGVSPSVSETTMNSMSGGAGGMDGMMDASAAGGPPMGGGMMRGGGGGIGSGSGRGVVGPINAAGGVAGDAAGGVMDRTGEAVSSLGDGAAAGVGSAQNATVETIGHGEAGLATDAHHAAAERAMPRPTRIAGVMLSGNSTSSGLLLGSRGNIELETGTQMQLGIVGRN